MYIGIDIGGTNLRVAEFDRPINPYLQSFKSIPTPKNYQQALTSIKELIGEVKVEGLGVGMPKTVHLPNWRNHKIQTDLQKMFACPVVVANDAAAAAQGEAAYGGHLEDFLFIAWGTGIGGAFVRGKKIYATEMGHQIIYPYGELCPCGQTGCLEVKTTVESFAQGIVNCLVISPVNLVIWAGGKAIFEAPIITEIEKEVVRLIKILPAPKFTLAKYREKAGVYGALSLLTSIL